MLKLKKIKFYSLQIQINNTGIVHPFIDLFTCITCLLWKFLCCMLGVIVISEEVSVLLEITLKKGWRKAVNQ